MAVSHKSDQAPSAVRDILRKKLLRWYVRHGRDLPWRRTRDPWHILVSETMLQQTQVQRVLARYPVWLKRFPTVSSLANASSRDVLLAWSGMGYNRRALNLHAASRTLMQRHEGQVPGTAAELIAIPGIGKYTAHAILCFAFDARAPVVDVNIRRVFSRVFHPMTDPRDMRPEKEIWEIAAAMLPPRAHYNWNQALMDLGATVCTSNHPSCGACPFRAECASAGRLEHHPRRVSPQEQDASPQPGHAVDTTTRIRSLPRRIHRGRVIEYLRRREETHTASFLELGRMLSDSFAATDHAWLLDILRSLEKDSLITLSIRGRRVTLTDDRPTTIHGLKASLP